jgi:hypothetical protein
MGSQFCPLALPHALIFCTPAPASGRRVNTRALAGHPLFEGHSRPPKVVTWISYRTNVSAHGQDPDATIRLAAVEQLKRASVGDVVTSDNLRQGFFFESQRIPFINPQRGIFKPAAMRYLLSVRTVFPFPAGGSGTTTNVAFTSRSRAAMTSLSMRLWAPIPRRRITDGFAKPWRHKFPSFIFSALPQDATPPFGRSTSQTGRRAT